MKFFAFDKDYLDRLLNGDAGTEHHFVAYFEQLLRIKLRAKMLAATGLEDLRQETFAQVMAALRGRGGMRQPERFGALVNSICDNVILEHSRSSAINQPIKGVDMGNAEQASERVRRILHGMSKRDSDILRAIFLEEKEKDTICREVGVDRDYLRVLLHRTKDAFQVEYDSATKHVPGGEHIPDANQIPDTTQQELEHTPAPPGASLHWIAEFTCSKKTIKQIVIPLLADMQFEHDEALSAGRKWEAIWIRVRGCSSLIVALGINRIVGMFVRILLRISLR